MKLYFTTYPDLNQITIVSTDVVNIYCTYLLIHIKIYIDDLTMSKDTILTLVINKLSMN